jgi:hypothetical protein
MKGEIKPASLVRRAERGSEGDNPYTKKITFTEDF